MKGPDEWKNELRQSLSKSQNVRALGGGVQVETIRRAESRLGYSLPESFKAFLETFGGATVRGHELNGLFDEAHCDSPPLPLDAFVGDIVATHLQNLSNASWPGHLVEILTFDGDETFCFDTSSSNEDGEYDIVEVPHYQFADARTVAKNFVEFVRYLG